MTRQTVVPDSSKRLSDGVLIETSVLARLLGVKLLTLEGTVVVTPAQLVDLNPVQSVATEPPASRRTYDALATPRRTKTHASTAARSDERVGSRLEEAMLLLNESVDDLDGLDQD
jgi:hypothetical protein